MAGPELRHWLQDELGQFPLFQFWGPATSINATRWIADASIKIDQRFNPTLTLVYLPHLDYCLQRTGAEATAIRQDLRDLSAFYRKYQNPFEPIIHALYGNFLKANRQPQGINSYDEVVGLAIAYYHKYGADAF